ncbi:dTDP-4-dehydrorhamnose 3,5-epimerase [Georgenia soli]|uniref:dTDP-4-dehydrorhamnose 3,5-epimerase n=1 Tax=Georgenia soli TaxID=638953 RepID=A0A2A9EL90_9MICO|nr:dTDP-4-dehydrorhamnose 3,5-epimerase family protein [Georgenia soli]PFG39010.1 dTDP-4-dehydrorhamnose 3,5-epimerase [Georgenia soli]
MEFRELRITGCWEGVPAIREDARGGFFELAQFTEGFPTRDFRPVQLHGLVTHTGVLRGFHYSVGSRSQSKYVTCTAGRVLDLVLDVRVGSPTYGQWDSVLLDDRVRRSVYVPHGVAHAVLSLADNSTILFASSLPSASVTEVAVDALDPALGIDLNTLGIAEPLAEPIRSERDAEAPTLAELAQAGRLPLYDTSS